MTKELNIDNKTDAPEDDNSTGTESLAINKPDKKAKMRKIENKLQKKY